MKKEGEREIKKAGGREGEGGVKIKKLEKGYSATVRAIIHYSIILLPIKYN